MATAPPEATEPVPAFCTCGRTKGFARSPVTGFWNCDYCGCPRQTWWEVHRDRVALASSRGLCTKMIGTMAWKREKCSGHKRD